MCVCLSVFVHGHEWMAIVLVLLYYRVQDELHMTCEISESAHLEHRLTSVSDVRYDVKTLVTCSFHAQL